MVKNSLKDLTVNITNYSITKLPSPIGNINLNLNYKHTVSLLIGMDLQIQDKKVLIFWTYL